MQPLSCPIPSELNVLKNNGFRFSIAKLPEVAFFCQEVSLPSIDLPSAHFGTPLVDVHVPGDKLTFGPLSISFLIDAGMQNYKAVNAWMVGLGFPKSHEQYKAFLSSHAQGFETSPLVIGYSDAVLEVLTASNTTTQSIHFIDCFPTNLSPIQFQTTVNDPIYLGAQASFYYTYYRFD